MRGLQWSRLLPAFLVALGLAFAAPAWAERKAGVPKSSAAEAYDDARQAALLQQQISELAPQKKGVTDIYAIGIAGWTTDVFRNELAGALRITSKALPLNGGTVRLINSRETADTVPLANRQNFAAAVRGIAHVMDREEDVLFLFMTSHGEKRSLGLQLPSTIVRLRPSEVAEVLNREGIKHRVVIVSACYSGIFVKPLANANTIVLTAADEKSASFGCAEGREWTYFGDALFQHSLKPGTDFGAAFAKARALITQWEKRDRFAASNPQGHFGAALVRKLAPLVKEMEQAKK